MNGFFLFLALVFLQPSFPEVFVSDFVIEPVNPQQEVIQEQIVEEEEDPVRIVFFGDMMLDRSVANVIARVGVREIFEEVLGEYGLGRNADIVSVNAEGPFADFRRETSKEIAFRFDPDLIPTLKEFGITLYSQANNHSLDMGAQGFDESIRNLQTHGLDVYGHQAKESREDSTLIKIVRDKSFAFVGFDDTFPRVNRDQAVEIIKDLEDEVDYTVVNMHWGQEYKALSNTTQQSLAHALIDAGADVIIGHHPHWVQEIELYKNRPIFYSLGNFVFDQYFSQPTQESIGVEIVFDDQELQVYVHPLKGERSIVTFMTEEESLDFLHELAVRSKLDVYGITGTLFFKTTLTDFAEKQD